jgi:hypothetical protein
MLPCEKVRLKCLHLRVLMNTVVVTDAISGMKELLSENEKLIEPSLAALISRCAALISDEACIISRLSPSIG